MAQRRFEASEATRVRVPLFIGLMGPSGGGKTFSALRLAEGIKSVQGGEIFYVDTEARRALHYADRFSFQHVPFGAPFGSLDYLEAIEYCVEQGAGVVVVDSMSHEHEGPGGLLEQHEREVQRLSGGNARKANAVKMLAWSKPKAARRRLINTILQLPVNVIFCFRAKEKIKIQRGKDPQPMGWMPIAGPEFIYEMTVNALLLPGSCGVPEWNPVEDGERQMVKLPGWARDMVPHGEPLDERAGAALARWAEGSSPSAGRPIEALVADYEKVVDAVAFGNLEAERRKAWPSAGADAKVALKNAAAAAKARLDEALGEPPDLEYSEAGGEA